MAENTRTSPELRTHFALGLFEGLLAGVAATIIFYRAMKPTRAGFSKPSNAEGGAISSFREHGKEILLKRESGETGGDPGQLVTANADHARPQFERPGGAPGPETQGEVLARPGTSGQPLPNGDASKPVQPASRTLRIS